MEEETNLVEHLVDRGAGLMNCRDDGSRVLSQRQQGLHDALRTEAVQASGRLVQKHEARVRHQLCCDIQTFSLTSRNAADKCTTNDGIFAL